MDSSNEYEEKAKKANQIANDCILKLRSIKKQEMEVIGTFNKKTDLKKIDKIKNQIEGL